MLISLVTNELIVIAVTLLLVFLLIRFLIANASKKKVES